MFKVLCDIFLPYILLAVFYLILILIDKCYKKTPRLYNFLQTAFKISLFLAFILSVIFTKDIEQPKQILIQATLIGSGIYILFKASKDEREFIIKLNLSHQIFIKAYNNTSFTEQFSYLQETRKSNETEVTMQAVNMLYEETIKKEKISEEYKNFDEVYNHFQNLKTPTNKLDFVWDLPAEYSQEILKKSLFKEMQKERK